MDYDINHLRNMSYKDFFINTLDGEFWTREDIVDAYENHKHLVINGQPFDATLMRELQTMLYNYMVEKFEGDFNEEVIERDILFLPHDKVAVYDLIRLRYGRPDQIALVEKWLSNVEYGKLIGQQLTKKDNPRDTFVVYWEFNDAVIYRFK